VRRKQLIGDPSHRLYVVPIAIGFWPARLIRKFLETFDVDPAPWYGPGRQRSHDAVHAARICLRAQFGRFAGGRRVGRDLAARRDAASG
jgi:hypothetical protein